MYKIAEKHFQWIIYTKKIEKYIYEVTVKIEYGNLMMGTERKLLAFRESQQSITCQQELLEHRLHAQDCAGGM